MYCSKLTSIEIPNSVTSIGESAFYYSYRLTEVRIGNSVTNIGESAFDQCSGLTSVNIPNSVTSIGNSAFNGCSSLTSIDIPSSVVSIGENVFSNCHGVTSIEIPNSVTTIGREAFYHCTGLTSVSIGNSVTSIGERVFCECTSLTEVKNGNSVTSIEYQAFLGTPWYNNMPNGLNYVGKVAYKYKGKMPENTSMTLNEGTVCIANQAFRDCSGMIAITIPSSVTSIEDYAFYNCSSLTDVYCYAKKVPSTYSSAFSDVPISSATLHVPVASVDAYKATESWCDFGSIVALDDEPTPEGIAIDETNFPDENFRNWVLSQSYGQDGVLTDEEIAEVIKVDVSYNTIQSLKGIEYFSALKKLNCDNNSLTSLDISNLTTLEELLCRNNGLTTLDVTKNTALLSIKCSNNSISSLDLSKNPELLDLVCNNNRLTTLDMSNNPYIEELECYNNQLTSLVLSNNSSLEKLKCYQNNIKGTSLDALIANLPIISKEPKMNLIFNVDEGNVITSAQIAASAAKGWVPQYFDGNNWQKYPVEPVVMKCATPTISFVNGKLEFSCETEGVEFVAKVTCPDAGEYEGSSIPLTSAYIVTVYAKKEGFENSDVATKEITVGGGEAGVRGDVNYDNEVGMPDVMFIVNYILNGKFPDE